MNGCSTANGTIIPDATATKRYAYFLYPLAKGLASFFPGYTTAFVGSRQYMVTPATLVVVY